jgi:hypothetical protein
VLARRAQGRRAHLTYVFGVRFFLLSLTVLATAFALPAASGAQTPAATATSAPALLVLPAAAQTITYQFSCPPHGGLDIEGNGGTIALRTIDAKNVAVTVTTPGHDAPISYKGTIGDDGTISVGVVREWLTALNEVIAISHGATDAVSAGNGWDSSTIIASRSGEAQIAVPLRVLVASTTSSGSGRDVQLMAAGGLHALVRDASSIAAPRVALYLQIADHFVDGSLKDAAGAMSGSMISSGVATKGSDSSMDAIGGSVAGGANAGQEMWTLTLVPAAASQ